MNGALTKYGSFSSLRYSKVSASFGKAAFNSATKVLYISGFFTTL